MERTAKLSVKKRSQPISSLKKQLPDVYKEFETNAERLEKHYRDVQDLEFTIEKRKLWMLQTRSAKRTAQAAVKIAVDMVQEGLITQEEAFGRTSDPEELKNLLASGGGSGNLPGKPQMGAMR